MVRLVKIVVILGLLWSAYWYGAGFMIRRNLSGWLEQQAALGWQADVADMSTTGYPLEHVTTLTSPALADPGTGIAWSADWLDIASPALKPGTQALIFPSTPQRLSHLDQSVALTAQDMRADLILHTGKDMQLEKLSLTSGAWQITEENDLLASGDSLILSLDQGENPAEYHFTVDADTFTPGERMRRLMRPAANGSNSFDRLALDMSVTFDRPWDRTALELSRPQPALIDLKLAELQWGALRLKMAGTVTVANGVPTGNVTIQAENWQDMLDMARNTGAMPEAIAGTVETTLRLLSRASGNRDALDVELGLKDGRVYLGPLPIGPAPLLILR